MLMSFLGSIGNLMAGSGFAEVLEECYGPNTVLHMMSGKAIARALRGYFLVDSALRVLLVRQIIVPSNNDNEDSDTSLLTPSEVQQLTETYDDILNSTHDLNDEDILVSYLV